ncbi:MAG: CDP-glucose 4,6-dehydratase [Akkermansia sp.]
MKQLLDLAYRGKTVFLTGHTGFKGAWLAHWLLSLGAKVHGYALDPEPQAILYDQLRLSSRLESDTRADIADEGRLFSLISEIRPDFVFHLAAQPLVQLSYKIPVKTFETNVMGTIHILDAIRRANIECRVICITTDKCYQNNEWLYAYREIDPMGGHDPYSASKGCAELAIACYRQSYFPTNGSVRLSVCRAGNVIGGGDWALDRIIPDCIRSLRQGRVIPVRNRTSTRPWQHVLEPLSGYLLTGAALDHPEWWQRDNISAFDSFNFGPNLTSNKTVADLVDELIRQMGDGAWEDQSDPLAPHEASKLNLAIDKAYHILHWQPTWNFETTLQKTAEWYQLDAQGDDMSEVTTRQITEYLAQTPVQFLSL